MKSFKFNIDKANYEVSVNELGNNQLEVTVNGRAYTVELEQTRKKPQVVHHVVHHVAPAAGTQAAAAPAPKAAPSAGGKVVSSPLPGSITQIMVTPGQSVKQGDILLVMESMKMANNITSEFEGTVKTIFVQQGASVMQGDNLVEIA